ncbi:MAG: ATP-dependent DNA helicase RecG [Pontibacterium sp.]
MPSGLEQTPVKQLKGVGPALELKLLKLGISSVQDVLFHLPLRYQDRTKVTPIGSVQPHSDVLIEGEVRVADIVGGRRRSLICRIQDGTGSLTLRFFHFNAAQKNQLVAGARLRCFGEARVGSGGLEMVHPEYSRVSQGDSFKAEDTLTPVYPSTEGVHQKTWRSLTQQALKLAQAGGLAELMPEAIRAKLQMPSLLEAARSLHNPNADDDVALLQSGMHPAQRRMVFEELLAHHLSLLNLRQKTREKGAPVLMGTGELEAKFLADLPFSLTKAQTRVIEDVKQDIRADLPMLRLVQGDVGSGKTMVAALAAIRAVESGKQAAVMAPTEILAEQHYQNFKSWLEPLGVRVAWLAGKVKGKARAEQLGNIRSGAAQVVLGTHALFQEEVVFDDLALVVVDEQHRFGVHQRLSLREKGRKGEVTPHQLIMTATPIPRTLTMSAYADLDCSIIDELPPGRTPINTVLISDERRDQVIERVNSACAEGKQVYWVCTLVEESDALQAQAAEVTAEDLTKRLPKVRVGLVHGRMKPAEKAEVMAQFKAAELDVLVATTVIEVGVDVPNASVMIIENPERLGLAQLHQLRGRVGRGKIESHCVLMYHPPLSQQGKARLAVMRETTDGFKIAEKDLEIRGPGEVLGTRQTGDMAFKIADLQRDADLLEGVKSTAQIVMADANLSERVILRWLGHGEEYGSV